MTQCRGKERRRTEWERDRERVEIKKEKARERNCLCCCVCVCVCVCVCSVALFSTAWFITWGTSAVLSLICVLAQRGCRSKLVRADLNSPSQREGAGADWYCV